MHISAKLVPVGYGIKKLQISCVVEDDKVSTDDLEDEIVGIEDYVSNSEYVQTSVRVNFASGQVDFQRPCLVGQVEILEKISNMETSHFSYLSLILKFCHVVNKSCRSLFSLRKVKFGVTRLDGQVNS